MPQGKPLTRDARDQITRLYVTDVKVTEIAAITGYGISVIYSVLAREGVPKRRDGSVSEQMPREVCGKPMRYVAPSKRRSNLGRFCSLACMGQARRLSPSLTAGGATELDCRRCGTMKPVDDFYPHSKIARGRQYWCKECCREARAERANLPKDPRSIRKWKLKGTYGITPARYDALYESQGGKCAICGILKEPWAPGLKRTAFLVVDHDHVTGEIRGLLCSGCNIGLGHFGDDAARLKEAIRYLKTSGTRAA